MEVSVGMGDSPSPFKAGKTAAQQALAGISGDPDILFTFIADGYKTQNDFIDVIKGFRNEIGTEIPSIGCLSPDVFISGNYPTIRGIATLAIRGNELGVFPTIFQNFKSDYESITNQLINNYSFQAAKYANSVCILLPTGPVYELGAFDDLKVINSAFAHRMTRIFNVISNMIASSQAKKGQGSPTKAIMHTIERLALNGISNIIGANAISQNADRDFEFYNDKIFSNSLVSCLLASDKLQFKTGWSFGGKPLNKTLSVDKSIAGGIMLEANGKNASSALLEKIGFTKEDLDYFEKFSYGLVYHLMVTTLPEAKTGYPFITLVPPFLDGVISMAPDKALKKGSEIELYLQSGEDILNSISTCLKPSLESIKKPEFAIIFECSNRAMALQDNITKEVDRLTEILGDDVPFIGYGGGGEFSYKGSGHHYVNSTIHSLVVGI